MTIKLYPPEYLFPLKILRTFNNDFKSYRDDMIKWMIDYSYKFDTFTRSNVGGYQSPDDFYLQESFAPYLNRITEHITNTLEEYVEDPLIRPEVDELRLSNMWFNFNYQNSYNVMHVHPGCILSGVIWIQVPDDTTPIDFECMDGFARAMLEDRTNEQFLAKEGEMYMFPAHLPHCVGINRSEHTRISLSFNIISA